MEKIENKQENLKKLNGLKHNEANRILFDLLKEIKENSIVTLKQAQK